MNIVQFSLARSVLYVGGAYNPLLLVMSCAVSKFAAHCICRQVCVTSVSSLFGKFSVLTFASSGVLCVIGLIFNLYQYPLFILALAILLSLDKISDIIEVRQRFALIVRYARVCFTVSNIPEVHLSKYILYMFVMAILTVAYVVSLVLFNVYYASIISVLDVLFLWICGLKSVSDYEPVNRYEEPLNKINSYVAMLHEAIAELDRSFDTLQKVLDLIYLYYGDRGDEIADRLLQKSRSCCVSRNIAVLAYKNCYYFADKINNNNNYAWYRLLSEFPNSALLLEIMDDVCKECIVNDANSLKGSVYEVLERICCIRIEMNDAISGIPADIIQKAKIDTKYTCKIGKCNSMRRLLESLLCLYIELSMAVKKLSKNMVEQANVKQENIDAGNDMIGHMQSIDYCWQMCDMAQLENQNVLMQVQPICSGCVFEYERPITPREGLFAAANNIQATEMLPSNYIRHDDDLD